MSASREKKNRQNQPNVAASEAPKKVKKNGLKKALTVVVSIIVIAAVIFLGMVSSGFFQKHLTAAVINGHKLSPVMLSYYYINAYSSLQNYTEIDPELPLSEQEYNGQNLAEYMDEYTITSASNMLAIYDAAVENGFELSEEEASAIDSELQMLDMYAQMYGFSSGNSMLVNQYGAGASKDTYAEYLKVTKTAQAYSTSIQENTDYSEEEMTAYFNENEEKFSAVTFRQFSVTPETLHVEADEAGLKTCEEVANTVAAAAEAGEEAFLDAATNAIPEDHRAEYDAATTTLRSNASLANISDVYKAWLADDARQEGDVTAIENGESGYIVLYFIRNEDQDFPLPNVRHILIAPETAEDEAAMADAKAEAEKILDEFLAGEQTEDAFAALAQTHSADNAEEGGLYENITPGSMVETFNDWCFDEARQVGDTGIVETEYGYHIMYFSGFGESYLDYQIKSDMSYADFQAWYEEVTADNSHELNEFGMRYVVDM